MFRLRYLNQLGLKWCKFSISGIIQLFNEFYITTVFFSYLGATSAFFLVKLLVEARIVICKINQPSNVAQELSER